MNPQFFSRIFLRNRLEFFHHLSNSLVIEWWGHYEDLDILVSFDRFAGNRSSFIPDSELLPGLRSWRDPDRGLAVESGNLDLGTQGGFWHGDRNLDIDILPLPSEKRVGIHLDGNEEVSASPSISTGISLPGNPDLGSRIDARGDSDRDEIRLRHKT